MRDDVGLGGGGSEGCCKFLSLPGAVRKCRWLIWRNQERIARRFLARELLDARAEEMLDGGREDKADARAVLRDVLGV